MLRQLFNPHLARLVALGTLFVLALSASISAQTPPKEIPNIFTPNGDGKNDLFELESTESLTLHIFNRSGNLVYKAEGKSISWDGNDERGYSIADGVYYYTLSDPAKTYSSNRGFLYISRTEQKTPLTK